MTLHKPMSMRGPVEALSKMLAKRNRPGISGRAAPI